MKTGIFGGSFDPPHNGHLALALFARELLGLDRLIVSVSKNPLKNRANASDRERIEMTRLLVGEINSAGSFAETATWEMEQPGPSWTIELLRYARELCGDDELVFLVGEDGYRQMPQWKEYQNIPQLCTIAVFGRATGHHDEESCAQPLPPALLFDFNMPVSATAVRDDLAQCHPVNRLVPPSIAAYIARHRLYSPV